MLPLPFPRVSTSLVCVCCSIDFRSVHFLEKHSGRGVSPNTMQNTLFSTQLKDKQKLWVTTLVLATKLLKIKQKDKWSLWLLAPVPLSLITSSATTSSIRLWFPLTKGEVSVLPVRSCFKISQQKQVSVRSFLFLRSVNKSATSCMKHWAASLIPPARPADGAHWPSVKTQLTWVLSLTVT